MSGGTLKTRHLWMAHQTTLEIALKKTMESLGLYKEGLMISIFLVGQTAKK
jgi:hypothetical protein